MNHDDVRSIAALARLEIPEDRLDRMAVELSEVLAFIATLDRLDLTGLEPLSFAPAAAPLREDKRDGRTLGADSALREAPERDGDFFLVPPVVENVNS